MIDQNPRGGTRISKGETVLITVSTGIAQVDVPQVTGKTVTDAIQILKDAGLDVQTRGVYADKPVDQVLKQDPDAGASVDKGSTVTLKVSKGVQLVPVPDVLQQTQSSAEAEIQQAGLKANAVAVASDQPAGLVLTQNPDAGTSLQKGSTVEIQVSQGPQTVGVPNVIGEDKATATSDLEAAGFQVTVAEQPTLNPSNDGIVLDQDPLGDSQVDPGSTVTITVGKLPF